MRYRNQLRDVLAVGSVAFGARASTLSPAMVEVYGGLDLDFVWLDFEHTGASPLDSIPFEHLARAAEAAGVSLLVRLPSGDPAAVRKVLDTGVRSIVVPRVETAADVRRAVRAARFDHAGEPGDRGVAHGRSTGWGTDIDLDREDDTVLVGAMIETAAAVDNLEDILSVPGLGFCYLGPGDLSVSLGQPMALDHPTVEEAVQTTLTGCSEADVPLGRSVTTTAAAREAIEAGYGLVRLGDEVAAVEADVGSRLEAVRESAR